ncbi:MAG TPA: TetR family transcriptional regulator [Planctomycetaceae bacterium]|nr:TetR family transcriptional regulator [Planctomycetaceae bacterium]HIQ21586.1 TetR family transcriptional regulator [Planctomycetota bacterium]
MSAEKNPRKSSSSRRRFLKSTGALAAGFALTRAARSAGSAETLAVFGGPKAVSWPDAEQREAYRWPIYGREAEEAVVQLVRRHSYEPIALLEQEWKQYTGCPHVKAHCNGTSALASMFFALDLPPGSEIMVPSYTFFATIVPMRLFGLVPVFVDINPRTLNFDLEDAKGRLTKDTKAVLPVHWLGLPCDMDEINDWAGRKGLTVLEDAAHAHGAELKGKKMGTWSRMGIYSYQASKLMPAIEGGMGMYENREDYERATTFGHYSLPRGFPKDSPYAKYFGTGLGLKFRMHPIAAALARCQLRTLDQRNATGVAQVRRLNDRLLQLPGLYEQTSGRSDVQRVYYARNVLFLDEKQAGMSRRACVKALRAEGVHAAEHTYRLQHKCALYQEAGWWHHKPSIAELPGCEQANATGIRLPYFTSEVPELMEQYAKAFEKVWAHRKELASVG